MLDIINAVGGLVNMSFTIVAGLALLAFFWGLARFIFHVGGDEKAVDEGKRIMKWGLLALFVMVSVSFKIRSSSLSPNFIVVPLV